MLFPIENIVYLLRKHATLMRRSMVMSLPLQIVFPGLCNSALSWKLNEGILTKHPPLMNPGNPN
jgi:hypothetical protein